MINTILKCENLNKNFGKKKILKDVSFTIKKGDILGFIGPNGRDKTTTIKLILGLSSIDSGNVTINGFYIRKNFESAVKGVALPIVGVGAADIINLIAINRNIIPLKYFVTLNWNCTNYLYGGVNSFPTLSIPFSILICAIYFLIMIITAFIVFNKRNIKNI